MKLVVVPSESIQEYVEKGQTRLEEYYNPGGKFDTVYVVSPLESSSSISHGMEIIPVRTGREFTNVVSELGVDVVRAYGGYWAANFVARYCPAGVPCVVSVHDTNPLMLYSSVRYFDAVIAMTKAVQRSVLSRAPDVDRISILPNRVSVDDFLSGGFPEGIPERYILHVGRRTEQKNLETVIRSLQYVDESIHVVSIGLGDESVYRNLALELGLDSRVHFLDSVKNNKLGAYYRHAVCFCLPTRWEGFGVVFLEAAASGVPIIASNIEPLNEFLVDGENALLLSSYDDAKALARCIYKLLNSDGLREQLIANANTMVKRYSREAVNTEEVCIYNAVIAAGVVRRRMNAVNALCVSLECFYKVLMVRVGFHFRRLFL